MKKLIAVLGVLATLAAAAPAAAQIYTQSYSQPYVGYSSCPTLSYNLFFGVRDFYTQGQVTALQQFLAARGYYQPVSGFFGSLTRQNVAAFQRQYGILPITGGVEPITRSVIAQLCQGGSPNPYPTTLQVTSPLAGQTYARGGAMTIAWTGPVRQTFAFEQDSSIVDLYSVQTGKVGTIAIQNGLSGSYQWGIPPFPNNRFCTMQYPNALCGVNLPDGQYYIKVTVVQGSGFDNGPVIGSANSGTFTIVGSGTQSNSIVATPQSGPAPLMVTFSLANYSGTYRVDFGDGTSASLMSGNTTHTYTQPGTYTATFITDYSCLHSSPMCAIAEQNLGSVVVVVN